jgi:hypothetical protein
LRPHATTELRTGSTLTRAHAAASDAAATSAAAAAAASSYQPPETATDTSFTAEFLYYFNLTTTPIAYQVQTARDWQRVLELSAPVQVQVLVQVY